MVPFCYRGLHMLVNATQVVSIYRSGYFFLKVEQKSSPGMQVWTMWEPDQKHVLQHVEFVLWSSSSSHHHDTYALSALSKYFQIQMAFIATIKKATFCHFLLFMWNMFAKLSIWSKQIFLHNPLKQDNSSSGTDSIFQSNPTFYSVLRPSCLR